MPLQSDGHSKRFFSQHWLWGVIAGLLWFVTFSSGILIDSEADRIKLGWKSAEQKKDAELLTLAKSLANTASPLKAQQTLDLIKEVSSIRPETTVEQKGRSNGAVGSKESGIACGEKIKSFFWATYAYMPTNVALLTLLAAFLGGCASNAADKSILKNQLEDAENEQKKGMDHRALIIELKQRLIYLDEHPAYSMIRGLIVYLVFIAGLYIASGDPFGGPAQEEKLKQYIRLAGLLSLLGFLVGYDPSRFRSWLALIPSPTQLGNPSAGQQGHSASSDSVQGPLAQAGKSLDRAEDKIKSAGEEVDAAQEQIKKAAEADQSEANADREKDPKEN